MTTTTLAGYQVSYAAGVPNAFAAADMTIVTSSAFSFRYSIDTPSLVDYSPITVDPDDVVGSAPSITINGTEIDLNTDVSVAQVRWTDGDETNFTLMMKVEIGAVDYFFAMTGDDLPAITNLAGYNAVFGGSIANSNASTWTSTAMKPGQIVRPELTDAFTGSVEADLIVGNPDLHDWSDEPLDTGAGNDSVTGTNNVDLIELGTGDDTASGLGGADRIFGEAGNDTILGGAGNDTLIGAAGADSIDGGADNDRLDGGDGADTLLGDAGNDYINGGAGNDNLFGGAGNDTIIGGNGEGADSVVGGDGNDRISTGAGNDSLYGGADNDNLSAGIGNDIVEAGTGDDTVSAGAGNDSVLGEAGADVLRGDGGNDTLNG
ncbi:MAG TPA: hypothetical protein DEF16_13275, partial [Gemmobacter sp.]|nr:hypothetical protein [Gemmobacter sp.]